MKTKFFLITALSILSLITNVFAQDKKYGTGKDSVTCMENLAVYQLRYKNEDKAKEYTTVTIDAWRKAFFLCPQSSLNMYVPHGTNIMSSLIKKEKDQVKAKKYIDTLMMIYDRRIQYLGDTNKYIGLKAADMFLFDPSRIEEAFAGCAKSVNALGNESEVKTMIIYMQIAVKKVQNKTLPKEKAIAIYQQLADIFSFNIANGSAAHSKQVSVLESLFVELKPECSEIVKVLEPKFAASPQDTVVLEKIVSILNKDCSGSDLYINAAINLDKIRPSAVSKKSIAESFAAKKQTSNALEYFKEAVALEKDASVKAEIYLRMAQVSSNSASQSVNYAEQAIRFNPNMGKAYLFIAAQYASNYKSCSEKAEYPDVARWTILWIAADLCVKAKSVDPSVASQANSQIASYRANYPNAEELFGYNVTQGSTQSINCWISGSTTAKVK